MQPYGERGFMEPIPSVLTSEEMRKESGRAILRRAFRHLEQEVPDRVAWVIRNLRHPDARWIRIPTGMFLIAGAVFSILPFLGIWMLPLGLLLMAYDVPFLRRPVGRFTIWGERKWASLRLWMADRRGRAAPEVRNPPEMKRRYDSNVG
jgi:hypothetical protein